jgi:FkbM family methyltransferase
MMALRLEPLTQSFCFSSATRPEPFPAVGDMSLAAWSQYRAARTKSAERARVGCHGETSYVTASTRFLLARSWTLDLTARIRSVPGSLLRLLRRVPVLLRVRYWVLPKLVGMVAVRDYGGRLERIGSRYGGWIVPTEVTLPGSVCYLAGLGEDASLDLALAARGCEVVVIDPTPRAIAYAEVAFDGLERVRFLPVGLWSSPKIVRFYAPADPTHISYSAVNLQGTTEWFDAPCRTLAEIAGEFGHREIDLLKLDIEGAEFEVLDGLIADGLRPRAICVEFDQPVSVWRIIRQLRHLARAGYGVVAREHWNFTLVIREGFRF